MRLDMSQHMRMLQQMKLAPRMIQSMEILQLPVMALEERIRQEEQQNPTLETGPSPNEQSTTDLEAQFSPESPAGAKSVKEKDGPSDQEFEAFEQLDREWSENYIPEHRPSRAAGIELSEKKHEAMQNMADRPASLEEHLLEQLGFFEAPPDVLDFARHIVANLDERGFLREPLESLRSAYDRPVSPETARRALEIVHSCEPTGVGAQNLAECLLLQLEDPNPEIEHVPVLRAILKNHFDDLMHNRLPVIQRKTGYSLEVIQKAIEEMRHLNLNPGASFASTSAQYVVPDVAVEQADSGEFVIKMNETNTPHIRISKEYQRMLEEKSADPAALEFIKKKIEAARWLIESIQQRRNTLRKVTQAIIDHQRAFLEKGPDFIEPLKMQQIADKVGVHVTTVSRAVDGKWVQTPRGVFPLKRFFGGGTVTADGEEVAWDAIKRKLTEIIDAEDKRDPYSDDELVKQLADRGYPLARRTVTKYRKMLSIPSSRQRKLHI
jgi:RNA polymerase sigma-54 factor